MRAVEDAASRSAASARWSGRQRSESAHRTPLRIVDGIVTGTHEPGSSHHELLRAFVGDRVLADATRALERDGFRTHEFGDSMLVFADALATAARLASGNRRLRSMNAFSDAQCPSRAGRARRAA